MSLRKTAQITEIAKKLTFSSSEKSEAVIYYLSLPVTSKDIHLFLLPEEGSEPAVEVLEDTVVSSKNVQRLIEPEHLLAKEKLERAWKILSLYSERLSCNILSWIPVDGGQVKSCAREMCTWSQAVSKMLQTKIEGKGSSITEKLQMHLLT